MKANQELIRQRKLGLSFLQRQIEDHLREAEMSSDQFGAYCRISQHCLSRIFGRRKDAQNGYFPTEQNLRKILKGLGVDYPKTLKAWLEASASGRVRSIPTELIQHQYAESAESTKRSVSPQRPTALPESIVRLASQALQSLGAEEARQADLMVKAFGRLASLEVVIAIFIERLQALVALEPKELDRLRSRCRDLLDGAGYVLVGIQDYNNPLDGLRLVEETRAVRKLVREQNPGGKE